jgi:transposase
VPNVASLPTDVATLQSLVLEQQHMIDTLKANLHLALHRQFGRRNESVDVDQIGLFAGAADAATIIELDVASAEATSSRSTPDVPDPDRAPRKQAVRILKDLPREIRIVDLPEADKVCGCCGNALHHFGDETSEHLTYVPAAVKVLETRRKKYVCTTQTCTGEVKRAVAPRTEPLAKGMASASLLAFLITSKFADGLPLYRIAARLQRLGIELAHGLMSDWLVQCAELLEPLHARMLANVLASGHVFTDDTILPLQNDEPGRKTTVKARLWVYARSRRRHRPLVAYTFSRSRSQSAPLGVLKDFTGYVQCDAFPGYDALFEAQSPLQPLAPKIREVACWVHARRKFVEVTELMKQPGRAHDAIAFIKAIYRVEKQIRPLDDATRQAERQRRLIPLLTTFKAWLDEQANAVLPKSAMGNAVSYTLKNWDALTRFTEQGYLEPDNNYAEQCLRPVAIGRKNFLFVGSERAGRAAAIYYGLVESCKVNRVNPLTYLTYVLSHVRDPRVTLLTPDEYAEQHPRDVTRIG